MPGINKGGNFRGSWTGSAVIEWEYDILLTDAEPIYSRIVIAELYSDLVVDVKIDKGATVDILPILSPEKETATTRPAKQTVIPDGGDADGCAAVYSDITARRAKVTVTKTEAGDSTISQITISGRSR